MNEWKSREMTEKYDIIHGADTTGIYKKLIAYWRLILADGYFLFI